MVAPKKDLDLDLPIAERRRLLEQELIKYVGVLKAEDDALEHEEWKQLDNARKFLALRNSTLAGTIRWVRANPTADAALAVRDLIYFLSDMHEGCCYLSAKRMGQVLNRNERNIRHCLSRLVEGQIIRKVERRGRTQGYYPLVYRSLVDLSAQASWFVDAMSPQPTASEQAKADAGASLGSNEQAMPRMSAPWVPKNQEKTNTKQRASPRTSATGVAKTPIKTTSNVLETPPDVCARSYSVTPDVYDHDPGCLRPTNLLTNLPSSSKKRESPRCAGDRSFNIPKVVEPVGSEILHLAPTAQEGMVDQFHAEMIRLKGEGELTVAPTSRMDAVGELHSQANVHSDEDPDLVAKAVKLAIVALRGKEAQPGRGNFSSLFAKVLASKVHEVKVEAVRLQTELAAALIKVDTERQIAEKRGKAFDKAAEANGTARAKKGSTPAARGRKTGVDAVIADVAAERDVPETDLRWLRSLLGIKSGSGEDSLAWCRNCLDVVEGVPPAYLEWISVEAVRNCQWRPAVAIVQKGAKAKASFDERVHEASGLIARVEGAFAKASAEDPEIAKRDVSHWAEQIYWGRCQAPTGLEELTEMGSYQAAKNLLAQSVRDGFDWETGKLKTNSY